MIALLTTLLTSIPPATLPHVEAISAVDFARLTVEDAAKLVGRDVLGVVPLDVDAWPVGAWHIYGCVGRVGVAHAGVELPERSAWLRREHGGERVTVRGRVEVIRHRAAVHGGEWFEGFVEVRFTER